VANIHAYIELAGDQPAESSLEALGEGRRIASALGATLHAVVACAIPPRGADGLIETLGRHGADKVVLVSAPELAGPLLHATHGPAVAAACEKAPPALVLLAATAGGRDLAPRLAARLGAAYLAEASVEYGARGELLLSRIVYTGAFRRRLQAGSRGAIHVAVFGSDELEVGDILLESLALGPTRARAAGDAEIGDLDQDGWPELLLKFWIDETGVEPDDTEICLTGLTASLRRLEGCDPLDPALR